MEIPIKKIKQMEKENKTIYISGRVSGLNINNAIANFNKCEIILESQYTKVINPFKIIPFLNIHLWLFHMIADIQFTQEDSSIKNQSLLFHLMFYLSDIQLNHHFQQLL